MKFLNRLILAVFLFSSNAFAVEKDLRLILNENSMASLYDLIEKIYVEDVDKQEVYENAIKGMLKGLDPHSDFLKPKEQKQMEEYSTGKFGGIGIVISKKDDFIEIVSPIDDTPGFRAGLKTGDTIIKIDDTLVKGLSLEDGVDLMRGKKGEKVVLTISRKNKPLFEVDIIRDIITIISAKGYLLDKDLGYIRVSSFQAPTNELVLKTLKNLIKENEGKLKSIILDLRNNPGGLLTAAVQLSDVFLDKNKLVVYTQGRDKKSREDLNTKNSDQTSGAKIVVLVNKGSASASEIVTGALRDHKRAVIVGETTFGKGSVQSVIPLPGGYGLKLTIARYYTPNGVSIQAKGITPDIELKDLEVTEKDGLSVDILEKDLKNSLAGSKKSERQKQINKDANKASKHLESEKEKSTKEAIENLKKDYFIQEAINVLKVMHLNIK